ncbi:Abi-domain-containing protein [Wallemia mellicola]|nr:Abi-domain-containing protein [Wallemia mellicola]
MTIGIFLSLTFSISYVYAVYFTSLSRGQRDDPAVMISRMKNVVVSNIACLIVIVYLEMKLHNHSLFLGLKQTGLSIPNIDALKPIILAPILYFGHIVASLLTKEPLLPTASEVRSLTFVRNIIVAPITEEITFRACIISAFRLDSHKWSNTSIILLTPLFFGLAHVHHGRQRYLSSDRSSQAFIREMLVIAVQLTYTTLFGSFAAYVFLRTNSIWPCILTHMQCNYFGLPNFGLINEVQGVHRKVTIGLSYTAGIALFTYLLRSL